MAGLDRAQIPGQVRHLAAVWIIAEPIVPSPEVLSWVRSRAIAYAKAKSKSAAA